MKSFINDMFMDLTLGLNNAIRKIIIKATRSIAQLVSLYMLIHIAVNAIPWINLHMQFVIVKRQVHFYIILVRIFLSNFVTSQLVASSHTPHIRRANPPTVYLSLDINI